jgi:hypothetical protein
MRVAGLAPVELPDVENINVTEWVPGHMSYRTAMPRLLREAGWLVESDEFTEIEDPDPDNNEKRQRELINEIEEARKQLQEKPEKSRFAFWKRKKAAEKKEWETYDEKSKAESEAKDNPDANGSGVLFDIEAIRREVADLSIQGIEVKELGDSPLPPMKIELNAKDSSAPATPSKLDHRSQSSPLPGPMKSPAIKGSSIKTKQELDSSDHKTAGLTDLEKVKTAPSTTDTTKPLPRPPITSSKTAPIAPINLEHNAWADEFDEEFGKEKELTLTFE